MENGTANHATPARARPAFALRASAGRRAVEFARAGLPAGLQIVGAFGPPIWPWSPAEDRRLVQMINDSGADVAWIGLGSPKQEQWMAANRDRLNPSVLIGVGAAFDFLAGTKRRAPPWMRRAGLEWLHRLISEPARLWRRYLLVTPRFVPLAVLQALGLGHYPVDG